VKDLGPACRNFSFAISKLLPSLLYFHRGNGVYRGWYGTVDNEAAVFVHAFYDGAWFMVYVITPALVSPCLEELPVSFLRFLLLEVPEVVSQRSILAVCRSPCSSPRQCRQPAILSLAPLFLVPLELYL
jgi:hypothetical protein